MKGVLRDMKCNCINDLGVANALYRPGAIQYITNYINRKRGEEKITYIHEDLQPILSATYGIIVFQEQLIDIGRYAGLRNPDDLRRATAKKKPELMAKIEPEFRHGLIKQNWLQEQIDKLWNDILEFAKYSFNKSHAIAYALTAYISMHLKVHYPVECMTAFINSYKGDAKGIIKAIAEVQRMGIDFRFDYWRTVQSETTCRDNIIYLCINSYKGDAKGIIKAIAEVQRMGIDFRFDYWRTVQSETTCRDNIIYLGINTLKGFGDNVAPALRAITANNFIDLIKQVKESDINKSQFRTLIKLDFFNEFGRTGKLVNLYDAYQNVYDAKIFTKGRCPVDEKLVAQCSKETAKQYREIDNEKLFNLLCITIKDESIPLNDMIATEIAAKGYITYRDKRLKNYFLVIDMNTKYSPKMKLYSLETGEIT